MTSLHKFINKYLTQCILGLIIFLALILRIYNLDKNPAGFFCDEATNGYNAYKIMTTGRDESGVFLPMFFKSLEYSPPIAIYSTIPFVAIFGMNETAVRLQAVFFGIILIASIYLLGEILFSKSVGLWSAFIGATIPWLIHYNRVGFDYNCYVSLYILSLFLFIKQIKKNTNLILGFLFFGITLYTYQPAKLIVPLTLMGLCLIYRKKILEQKRGLFLGIFVFLLVSTPLILNMIQGYGIKRFQQVSIFSAHLPLTDTLLRLATNYSSQLSLSFFLSGEKTPITRHFINGLTPFLYVTLPFMILGVIVILVKFKKTSHQVLLLLLLLYPLSASVSAEGPFTGRTIIGAPLFSIIIGLGIISYISIFKNTYQKILSISVIILLIFFSLTAFLNFYFKQYPLISSDFWGWQYGARDIVHYFTANESKYDQLIMAPEFNAPEIFLKFYAPTGCQKCIIGLPHERLDIAKNQLFAVTPLYLSQHPKYKFTNKHSIIYPNGSVAFRIGQIVQ